MADVYLHSRFTENLLNELPSDIIQDIAFLGCQGPDAFYYARDKEFKRIADDIHRYRTRDLFKTMVNYVKENYSKEAYSYLFGFISHYVLDIYIHPYIYYKTGIYESDNPSTHYMRGLHKKFEHAIDCLQIEKELKIKAHKLDLTTYYYPLKEAPKEVLELMHFTLKREYQLSNGYSMAERSAKEMYKMLKYIGTDRTGIKKLLYKFFDLFNKKNDLFISDMSSFNQIKNYDYHNDAKNVWLHPLTGEEYTTSIDEIIEEAKVHGHELLTKVDEYIHTDSDINLDDLFTDLSFNTGKPCEMGMDFKYTDIYTK